MSKESIIIGCAKFDPVTKKCLHPARKGLFGFAECMQVGDKFIQCPNLETKETVKSILEARREDGK